MKMPSRFEMFIAGFLFLALTACGSDPNPLFGGWDFATRTLNDATSGNDILESERFHFSSSQMTLIKRCEIGAAATEVSVSAPITYTGSNEFNVVDSVESRVSLSYQGSTYDCQANIPAGPRIYIVQENGELLIYQRDSTNAGQTANRAEN